MRRLAVVALFWTSACIGPVVQQEEEPEESYCEQDIHYDVICVNLAGCEGRLLSATGELLWEGENCEGFTCAAEAVSPELATECREDLEVEAMKGASEGCGDGFRLPESCETLIEVD